MKIENDILCLTIKKIPNIIEKNVSERQAGKDKNGNLRKQGVIYISNTCVGEKCILFLKDENGKYCIENKDEKIRYNECVFKNVWRMNTNKNNYYGIITVPSSWANKTAFIVFLDENFN